ncbi:Eukaryotic aspartyl protease [Plasmodium yoelii yoelii]|uniref:Eukaryotic aspartyl protease n=1 Tax=Plasmodium yoelii yoelii TaxID=73239 RepID=Q7RN21_PLAYO|nr:Eukaryotic aspartyl protease [Plasmodium yoelii yoelii]
MDFYNYLNAIISYNLLGSTNLWIPSKNCYAKACYNKKKYDYNISKNYRISSQKNPVNIFFGTGKVQIAYATDDIHLGSIKNQEFGIANYMSDDPFSDMQFDGLFGLGISEDIKRKGLIYDNIPRNSSRKNVFSIYYPKSVDDNGAITFGGYDKKYIEPNSNIDWFVVSSKKYWTIKMTGIKINGLFLEICSGNIEGYCDAVIDTGTSSIAGPKNGVEKEYELTSNDYIVNSFKVDPILKTPCNFAFMPINISSPNGYLYVFILESIILYFHMYTHIILGQVFLQKYYAIFEKDNMRIGISAP